MPQNELKRPKKINNIYDLLIAVEAGQIESIKIKDKHDVPDWHNNKSFYVISFKTSKADGGKKGEFNIPEFTSPNVIENLAKKCAERKVEFKPEETNPALDNLLKVIVSSAPGVAAGLLGIFGVVGAKKYSLYMFEKRVRQNLVMRPTEVLDKELISRGNIRNVLVGMPEDIYNTDGAFWHYIDTFKDKIPSDISLDERGLSQVLAGMGGCGKTFFNTNALYHALNVFDGQNGRAKAGAIRIDTLSAEQSGFEKFMGVISGDAHAKIIAKVLEEEGINIGILYCDDPKAPNTPSKMLDTFKIVYDLTNEANKSGQRIIQSKGVIGWIKNLLGLKSKQKQASPLKTVHLMMTTNEDLPPNTLHDQAFIRRCGGVVRILNLNLENRKEMLKHFLANEYNVQINDVPDLLVEKLAAITMGPDKTGPNAGGGPQSFTPDTYKNILLKSLVRCAKPANNTSENIRLLHVIENAIKVDRDQITDPQERTIRNAIEADISSVTGENIPSNSFLGTTIPGLNLISAMLSTLSP
jgi:hypothetical protein